MADAKTIEVINGMMTYKHHGDTIAVDENGNLRILLGDDVQCVYTAKTWEKAYKTGNPIAKGA